MTSESDDAAMLDSLKPYLQLASGLVAVSATKAAEIAQGLLSSGGGAAPKPGDDASGSDVLDQAQIGSLGLVSINVGGSQDFVDDVGATDQFKGLVREEVDRVAHLLGFVREDELIALRRQVDRLETDLAQAREDAAAASMLAATEQAGANSAELTDTVLQSARRVIDIAGALDAVSGLPGGPWARVARDLASSAATLMTTGSAAPSAEPAPAAKKSTVKKSTTKKSAAKKSTAKKSAAKKAKSS